MNPSEEKPAGKARAAGSTRMSDADLIKIVTAEKRTALGFENDPDLVAAREMALNYYKGEMPDVPALPNRSKAVDSIVADAIETLLPDLMEIFTGGSDVVAFRPTGPEDEDAAQQETDYLYHVFFNENPGFMTLYTMFKDAALEKIGVATFRWDKRENVKEEIFEGKPASALMLAKQYGEVDDEEEVGQDPATGEPLYNFTFRQTICTGGAEIKAFAPSDFAVAPDTVALPRGTYCAFRSRPRAQDLIADGVDRAIVAKLPAHHNIGSNTTNDIARDTAGESQVSVAGDDGPGDLRQVEIITHYVRCDYNGDGTLVYVRVATGGDGEDTLMVGEPEIVNRVEFAAITPFVVTHRFYGQSLADKLVETARIKTALTRMLLDSGYFALNQRLEVNMKAAHPNFTISDLLRNEPGVPIRTNGEAIRPISSGALNFDVMGSLEYFSTVAEQRTGIVRNAQGLNPDTLHDTAKGALALMSMAQKRIRMIARIFAETGLKDLFLGVHALIRENATEACKVRLKGKWTEIDPTTWGERNDMTVEIGMGASGREHDAQLMGQVLQTTETIVTMQGGLNGPLVTAPNAYQVLKDAYSKMGIKTPEKYVSDPATIQQQQAQQPPPDPKMVAVQLEHERALQKQQSDDAFNREKLQSEVMLKKYEIDENTKAKIAVGMMGGKGVATHDPVPAHV